MNILYEILLSVLIIKVSDCARILAVYPTPSISHQIVYRPLTLELTKNGHEVVVVTTDPIYPNGGGPKNLKEINVHDTSYRIWGEIVKEKMVVGNRRNDVTPYLIAFKVLVDVYEKQIQSEEFKNLLEEKDEHFDLLLVEANIRPTIGLSHIYKVPLIQISSLGTLNGYYEVIGAPTHPILYPGSFRQRLYNLTNWEKLIEIYNHYLINFDYAAYEKVEDEMLRRNFGPDFPSLSELKNNVHMLFLNIHPMWEGNRPVPPSVVYMGGLPEHPEKDLPQDLQSYLDSSKHGVIYMSFGTNMNPDLLPVEKVKMMAKVFSELPYDVLWRWSDGELPGRSKNIRTIKWVPQPDLLRHPKLKLFITQAGLQSTDEAINAGIPVIGIPMLFDQWFNAEKFEYYKIGKILHFDVLTEDEFRNAVTNVAGDPSYRQNIVKLRSMMRDQPQKPLDRAIWWIEHVLRHGGAKHLRAPAANMSWVQYLELEFILYATLLLLSPIMLLLVVVIIVLKYFRRNHAKTKSD